MLFAIGFYAKWLLIDIIFFKISGYPRKVAHVVATTLEWVDYLLPVPLSTYLHLILSFFLYG